MGDDDVICLSSDDETFAASLPKRCRIVKIPVKDESQSHLHPDNSLKRKTQSRTDNETNASEVKRSKCSVKGAAEEVIILSPRKSENFESNCRPMPEKTTSGVLKPKLSMHVGKVNISEKILSKNAEFRDSWKKELPRRDPHVSSSCDEIVASRNHGNSESGSKEKSMSASSRSLSEKSGFRCNDAVPHTSEAKKLNVAWSKVSTTVGSKEHAEPSYSSKSADQSREKFAKSFSKNNDSHPACSNLSMPSRHERTSEKSISLVEKKSGNHADDRRNHSTLVPNLRSVSNGNLLNLRWQTMRPNSSNETPDAGWRSRMDTSVLKTYQRTANPKHERTKIVETAKSDDSLLGNESKKSFEVEIVETIEAPISDGSKHPSKDMTMERKNTDVNMKESVGGSSVAQKTSEIESPKSRHRTSSTEIVSTNKSPNSSNISNLNESSKIAKDTVEKSLSPPKSISSELDNIRGTSRTTTSPEIEIVEETKSSRTVEATTSAVGKSAENSHAHESSPESARASGKTAKIAAAQNFNGSKAKSENGQKEERNTTKSCNKDVSPSKAEISKLSPKIGNGIVDDSKIDEDLTLTPNRAKSMKLSLITSPDAIKKKIVPRRVTTSIELDEPASNDSSSKVSDVKNDDITMSSRSKDESKQQKPFEPVAGCSKTPDEVFHGKKHSEKKKSSPDPSFMTTLWEERDEPTKQLEPSESTDEREKPRKPHLIVKTIKPVVSVKHDTFAMFLSLCLQTERGEEMEKIVGKLKRYYEQLDPAYARSQEFTDLLNSRREKIIAKGKICFYIGQIFEEMKARRGRGGTARSEASSKASNNDGASENENELDTHEDRRLRDKIKTITTAMKKCSKVIAKLEVAEVDFDEDNDSDYIKLERYKRKMIELYTKLCEYTNEHADAGRAYLRPKHLRVTQIPSIDQAINSFINSKISRSLKKAAKGQSFVDGLIFPDYVDILECVDKVNTEQKLGLDKRRQEKLAREAFTQLGKHLQQARQRDYWDTFSLHLEDSEDPAASDPDLAEKLLQNQEIAEKNTREIFEEYVRKQEEGTGANDESSSTEDDKNEDDDDDEDNEKTPNNDAPREFQLSGDENDDRIDKNEDSDKPQEVLESIPDVQAESDTTCEDIDNRPPTVEVEGITNENNNVLETVKEKNVEQDVSSSGMKEIPTGIEPNESEETTSESPSPCEIIREDMEAEVPEVRMEDETNENNNVLKIIETKIKNHFSSSDGSKEASIDRETMEIEVKCAEADKEEPIKPAIDETTSDEVNHGEPDAEAGIDPGADQPGALRIRSFAKPPSSWASSQEIKTFETMDVSPIKKATSNNETIDILDDEPNNSAAGTTSITEVSVSPRIVRITRSIPPNSKEARSTRMPKILPKIAPAPKQRTLNGCPSIIIGPQNRSTFNQLSNFTKIVPNQDLSKKITLLPSVTIRPANNSIPQSSFRPANLSNSSIGTVRALNVPQNVRIAQNIQLRVGKNVRPVPADQVQVLRLANTNDLARSNDTQASSILQPRSLVASNNQILRVPVSQSIQPRALNAGQQVRIRVAGNGQVPRPMMPQQILRLSNGQLMRASTAMIRPLSASPVQIQGITLKNPRFIRLQTSNNNAAPSAVPVTVTRLLPDNGQLRIERIENASEEQRRPRSSHVDDSTATAQPSIARMEQQTITALKTNTNNNTPSDNQHRKRGNHPEHKNSCTVSNSEPPPKK